jgi:hypothetical protein
MERAQEIVRALPEKPGRAGQASYSIRLEEPKSVGHNDLVDSNGKGTRNRASLGSRATEFVVNS